MTATSTTVEAHRDQMLAQLAAGNAYGFLTMAHAYLRTCPDDGYLRLMVVREYLKLGLIAAARDTLERAIPASELSEQFTSLAASVRAIAGRQLDWSGGHTLFEANLKSLERRGMDTAPIRRAWAERSRDFERFVDNSGTTQIRRVNSDGDWDWIPALRDHDQADQEQPLPAGLPGRMPGPYVFNGLGQGGFFERVYHATQNTFLGFSCALFVVEPDLASFAMVLHMRDWPDILADHRVFLAIGEDWEALLRRTWQDDLDLPFPTQLITSGPRCENRERRLLSAIQAAMADCEQAIHEARQKVDSRYQSRDLHYWARRFDEALSGRGEPLRILAAVSTHTTFLQYSMRDAQRAFEALGHRCDALTETQNYQCTSPLHFQKAVLDYDPDVFFIIDHLRPEFTDVLPANLPILTWDQDHLPHVITRENIERMAPHDFLVGCSKLTCLRLGADARQVRQWLIPTCPEQFGGDPLTDQERESFDCDLSFVSHASQTPITFHEEERRIYRDDRVRKLLDAMFELMPETLAAHGSPGGYVTSLVLQRGMELCGIRALPADLQERLKNWYLWRLGDRLFRHQALEWAAQWAQQRGRSFRIYGNGWHEHPTLSDFAHGPAHNGRDLFCVYRASRINLQLMPAGFLHQRALDGLAAGGFFLTRRVPRDVTGRTLRSLVARIDELHIPDSHALRDCDDRAIRNGLETVLGPWLARMGQEGIDILEYLRVTAEVPFPDELFPRFRDIVFDSYEALARAADRFIDNHSLRSDMAAEMRDVVVRELAYQPTMSRFLTWMRDYLAQRSGGTCG